MSIDAMKQALEALEKLNGALEQADCSTGYCCCGSSVDGHTFGDGHSPVDEGAYCQSNALEYARKTITSLRAAIEAAEKQEPVAWLTKELMADYLDMIAEAIADNKSETLRHKAHWMRVRGEI